MEHLADEPPLTAADFGWHGGEHYPDFWDLLRDRRSIVPFGKVVSAHRETLRQEGALREEALAAERALRRKFEQQQGPIQNSFYCSMITGGAALTEQPAPGGPGQPGRPRLHTVLSSPVVELVQLDSDCGVLAEQAGSAFSEPRQLGQLRLAMEIVYSVMTRVLAAADSCGRPGSRPADQHASIAAAVAEYDSARRRIGAVIQRQARFTYFQGVLLGSSVALAICALAGLVGAHNWPSVVNTPAMLGAGVFGVLGAVTSVFQRMSSGQLLLDFNASRGQLILLGSARPFVGAVLGLVVQFALVGGFFAAAPRADSPTSSFGFFALAGFAAGFSERFATDMLERAGQIVGGATPGLPAAAPGTRIIAGPTPEPPPPDAAPPTAGPGGASPDGVVVTTSTSPGGPASAIPAPAPVPAGPVNGADGRRDGSG
jgi:hypothetical protein